MLFRYMYGDLDKLIEKAKKGMLNSFLTSPCRNAVIRHFDDLFVIYFV